MSFSKKSFRFIISAASVLSLSACNRDGVIEGEGDDPSSDPAVTAMACRVLDYTPAPGQFINESEITGTTLSTPSQAIVWAQNRLDNGQFVSLGGFGGYIVLGLDRSIRSSRGSYDFAIAGNAFFNVTSDTGGNEPGIVYVMADSNSNGLPDDVWYELKGSEYGATGTVAGYSVTYYRPSGPKENVRWTDSQGNTGSIDYLGGYHSQASYYPAWITADSYTLSGTMLERRNTLDESTGYWVNSPYGFGYADNAGTDNAVIGKYAQCSRFRISDAVDREGKSVGLDHIDFVKIQTGVNAKSGSLGEVSTEIFAILSLD